MPLKILVDENIPLARELFGQLGEITLAPGRKVTPDFPGLAEFDALAIRSVTDVTPPLVDAAANCRLIGTATIGTDHIDVGYIEKANARRAHPIEVVSAPGSNADSVADYVWQALAHVTGARGERLSGRSLGIIGHGNCGRRVARRAAGFGMDVRPYDPPLAERDGSFTSASFEEAIAADFVTCHVPLRREGESDYPTYHMIGERALAQMGCGAVLINSSRGSVIDSPALTAALEAGRIGGAVLDVFEGEPEPARELIELPLLATPHIAGYAVEAKRRGAVVIYEAMCRAFGVSAQDTTPLLMRGFQPPAGERVEFDASGVTADAADAAVRALFRAVCDIEATSRELKGMLARPDRGALFDRMRRDYEDHYGRHELAAYRVGFDASVSTRLRKAIGARLAGFGVAVTREPNYVFAVRL